MGVSYSYIELDIRRSPEDDDSNRPPDEIFITYLYGSNDPNEPPGPGYPYYVDFRDEDSLTRELLRFNMAGIVVWRSFEEVQSGLGRLYLIDSDHMPTSILREGAVFGAVYPAFLAQGALFYEGGEELRRRVHDHPSFERTARRKAVKGRRETGKRTRPANELTKVKID
ncbi:hypothetical protein TWF696_003866 [Orbilia brochopaga]|uniref:Uncharacterized protein n=1 Tax=Orbilia brochopaga TaxID=3140254 RepID=A0AAV9V632_9PEZI